MAEPTSADTTHLFPCERCGASLAFEIGSQALACPYCGFTKPIDLSDDAEIVEQDLLAALESQVAHRRDEASPVAGDRTLECGACGAGLSLPANVTAQDCPYCGVSIQVDARMGEASPIPVDAILPFGVACEQARSAVETWLSGLWFAPNDFTASDVPDRVRGVHVPYWTFDARTFSTWSGERGDAYYVTEGEGQNRRRVRRIRWSRASGSFQHAFDDEPVAADRALPREIVSELEPWPFERCVPWSPELVAGHVAKTFDVPLTEGFKIGRARMEEKLEARALQAIGGDAQRLHGISTRWDALTYKHVLLPIWMLCVRHRGRRYRIFVNATSGEVQGERPWSRWKIVSAVAAGLGFLLLAAERGWLPLPI